MAAYEAVPVVMVEVTVAVLMEMSITERGALVLLPTRWRSMLLA